MCIGRDFQVRKMQLKRNWRKNVKRMKFIADSDRFHLQETWVLGYWKFLYLQDKK